MNLALATLNTPLAKGFSLTGGRARVSEQSAWKEAQLIGAHLTYTSPGSESPAFRDLQSATGIPLAPVFCRFRTK